MATDAHPRTMGRDVGHPPVRTGGRRAPPRRPRRRRSSAKWRRVLRLTAYVCAPIVIMIAFVVLITYTRLSQGPISLDRIAAPIEQGISQSLGALSAKVGDVNLALTDDHKFQLQLLDLTILDSTGARVASAPVASASLSFSALLTGRFVPSHVYLIDPNLLVTYREGRGVSLQVASNLVQEPKLVSVGQSTDGTPAAGDNATTSTQQAAAGESREQRAVQQIDIAKVVSELNAHARQGMGANSKLKEIGVRNATVTLDYDGQKSEWLIAEAAVNMDLKKNSGTISGAARVQSSLGPWVLSFRTVDTERDNVIRLSLSARDLVPSSIASAAPALHLLNTLDMPVALDATMQVTQGGDMEAATLAIELAPGDIHLAGISGTPLKVDRCVFNLAYDGFENRVTVSPSTISWADSALTLAGEVVKSEPTPNGEDQWAYNFVSVDGKLAAEEFGVPGVKIDSWRAAGSILPAAGKLNIDTFKLAAANVDFSAKGEVLAGKSRTSTQFAAGINAQDLKLLVAIWPRAVAPDVRAWLGRNLQQGRVNSGTLKVVSGAYMAEEAPYGTGNNDQRVSLALELDDVVVNHEHAIAPAKIGRALIRLENQVLEVTVPEIKVAGGKSGDIDVKTMRVSAVDLFGDNPLAEIAFKLRAPVKSMLAYGQRVRPETWTGQGLMESGPRGLVVGDFKLQANLGGASQTAVRIIDGTANLKDFRLREPVSGYTVRGGALDLKVSDDAINAEGTLLINGVGARLTLQHIVGATWDKQPPLRIAATLDAADRTQLKMDINDVVDGDVPVDVSVAYKDGATPNVHVIADLTGADILFSEVAWRKAPGRKLRMEFDAVTKDDGTTEMQNIQAVGQGIAIEGWASIDKDHVMREFYFPDFSVDTVTRLKLQGKLDQRRIWSIKAEGPTYDGRTFFRSLFSLGDLAADRPKARNPAKGVDLDAKVENVVGSHGESLRQVRIKVSHRDGNLSALDGKARLSNGKQVAVLLRRDGAKRTLFAESDDAGTVLKLINFYPNMVGGRARLELDLDGSGAASQTGILWTENFRILGDEVASEVFAGASGNQGQRQVTRQVFDFTRLRMPFSVGHNQFVVKKSYLRGPVLGASLSGKVDFGLRRVNLGGSYIPLQGLNSALCGIPLLGEIITGPKCEGVLGITFAVQGAMASPQVIVNPLSLVAPGIFREIFQLTNPSVRVTPREQGRIGAPPEDRVRSSSSRTSGGGGSAGSTATREPVIDGWSSGTQSTQ